MSTSHDAEETPPPPTNAEDAKTLKALSALDAGHSSLDDNSSSSASANTNVEALGKATAGLSSLSAGKPADAAGAKKVTVKVAAEDVALIVEEMEISKVKATELLRANGADLNKTLRAMILPA
ncbi:hypothetical protein ABW19_dt0202224 [Dactylella cylindrospora]|nr:hypothetical protein ABW19_dt0202224 [Dactylella cylindrospora]